MDTSLEHKIIKMLMDDPALILLLKNKYITEDMWKTCLEAEPSLIEYIDEPTEEMCLIVLSDSGSYLTFMIDNGYEITPEMIMTAIKTYPSIIFDLPSSMVNDFYIELALDVDISILSKLNKIPYKYVMNRLKKEPGIIRYIENPSDEMVMLAINTDINTCAHIKNFSPEIKEFIETQYSDMAPMLLAMHDDIESGDDIEWEE